MTMIEVYALIFLVINVTQARHENSHCGTTWLNASVEDGRLDHDGSELN
jgi:hypothetical protein